MLRLQISKGFAIQSIITIVCLIICFALQTWKGASVFAGLIFIFYLYVFLKKYTNLAIRYFFVLFTIISTFAAIVVIEFNSIYLPELQTYTTYVGTLPLCALMHVFLILTIVLSDSNQDIIVNDGNISVSQEKNFFYLTIFITFIYVALFLQVVRYPAFLLGLDRVEYAELYAVRGIWSKLAALASSLLIIPCYLAITSKGKSRILGIFSILIYCLYLLWIGTRFGSFFSVITTFFIVYSFVKLGSFNNKKAFRLIIISAFILVGLIGVAVYINSITTSYDDELYLFDRTAQQNQMFWKIYYMYGGTPHIADIKDEINGLFAYRSVISENVGSNYGIYKIMYLVAPHRVVDGILFGGSRYTEAGSAAMLYYFGYIGPIVYAVFQGFVYTNIVRFLIKSINSGNLFRAVIYMRIITRFQTAFSMFLFGELFDFLSIICYLYLFVTYALNIKIKLGLPRKKQQAP